MKPKDVIERARAASAQGWASGFEAAKLDSLRVALMVCLRDNIEARVHPSVAAVLMPVLEDRMRTLGMRIEPAPEAVVKRMRELRGWRWLLPRETEEGNRDA